MACKLFIICCGLFQVAISQYLSVPVSSYPLCYSYYPSMQFTTPTYAPATPNVQKSSPSRRCPKRNVGNPNSPVKCSPQTATAYFLTTPLEAVKAKEKDTKNLVQYSCPFCNNFADVPRNSKIPPPPPVGAPVLPGVIDKVPTIAIPKKLTTKDPSSVLSSKTLFSDMCEKYKTPKKMSYDQELLEGFLTGLGITL